MASTKTGPVLGDSPIKTAHSIPTVSKRRARSAAGQKSSLKEQVPNVAGNDIASGAIKDCGNSAKPSQRRCRSVQPKSPKTVEEPIVPDTVIVIDRALEEANRSELTKFLQDLPSVCPKIDPRAFHGRSFRMPGNAEPPAPRVVWKSDKKPRQASPSWLTASEYAEDPAVFKEKIKLLAILLKASRRSLAYTGAGLSVAAGIGMAAVGSIAQKGMGIATAGEPTLAHCVMAELNRQNLLHGWVQQNHDGLPQKAGYRQEDINEIHGSWFDPSNPVVKYSGSLRDDLYDDMVHQAESADLVIVVGTSLTGLNADQCVDMAEEKSSDGQALGSVIISPQRTEHDGQCSLRIFARADNVMGALATEFAFGSRALGRGVGIKSCADLFPKEDKVFVPYDANGVFSTTVRTWWDLSPGSRIRIGVNNNIRGAQQPGDKNITDETVGRVEGRDPRTCSFKLVLAGHTKRLGFWWFDSALRGAVPSLPVVNVGAKAVPA